MKQALPQVPNETFAQPDPTNPTKPILAGNYLDGNQIHTILYYVNKNDPAGPAPSNPAGDPQFKNWEAGVLTWASRNIPNFQNFNQGGPVNNGSTPTSIITVPSANAEGNANIRIERPLTGTGVGNSFSVSASASSQDSIKRVSAFWNGKIVQDVQGELGKSYTLSWMFTPQSFNSQNVLEIQVIDSTGAVSKSSITVSH